MQQTVNDSRHVLLKLLIDLDCLGKELQYFIQPLCWLWYINYNNPIWWNFVPWTCYFDLTLLNQTERQRVQSISQLLLQIRFSLRHHFRTQVLGASFLFLPPSSISKLVLKTNTIAKSHWTAGKKYSDFLLFSKWLNSLNSSSATALVNKLIHWGLGSILTRNGFFKLDKGFIQSMVVHVNTSDIVMHNSLASLASELLIHCQCLRIQHQCFRVVVCYLSGSN